jgi:hypothetical protein
MNDIRFIEPFSDIREETDLSTVRLLLHGGWFLLEIYKKKKEVPYSSGEYEEYPVYILANSGEEQAR